ncbi:MAG: PqiC family protein [Chromatiaceae bacterium]|jgi:uncharacterized protein
MYRLAARAILCSTLILLAACASTPASQFYTLSAAATPGAPPSRLSVVVGPVSVPASVDRPEFVVTQGPNQVRLDEFHRWAAPLQDEIARAVAENLVLMLGTPNVTLSSQMLGASAQYRAVIEVQKFVSTPGEGTTLDAIWNVRRVKDGKSETGRTALHETVHQQGYEALVAAHSRAITRLSQDIANAVRALNRLSPHGR